MSVRLVCIAFLLLIPLEAGWACSCARPFDPCKGLEADGWGNFVPVAFVGTVIRGTGEGMGTGPGRMRVEERLRGLAPDVKEVTVDTSVRSSCYVPLKDGERWVIFGDRKREEKTMIRSGGCTDSFRVNGREKLLAALRDAVSGQSGIVLGYLSKRGDPGVFSKPTQGVRVAVTQGESRFETATDANGEFEFRDLQLGQWKLHVTDSRLFLTQQEDGEDPGVQIGRGCVYTRIEVWPNGQIAGTVRGADGAVLENAPVQVFEVDEEDDKASSSPFRTVRTDAQGRYHFRGLPPGKMIVAVREDPYKVREPWLPRYDPSAVPSGEAQRLMLPEAGRIEGIDLQLAEPPKKATLLVRAVFEDGTPARGFKVYVKNQHGRSVWNPWYEDGRVREPDHRRVPVYLGETYSLECAFYEHHRGPADEWVFRSYEGTLSGVKIDQEETEVRVVLRLKEGK